MTKILECKVVMHADADESHAQRVRAAVDVTLSDYASPTINGELVYEWSFRELDVFPFHEYAARIPAKLSPIAWQAECEYCDRIYNPSGEEHCYEHNGELWVEHYGYEPDDGGSFVHCGRFGRLTGSWGAGPRKET